MRYFILITLVLYSLTGCQEKQEEKSVEVLEKKLYKPHEDLGVLFVDVQLSGIFEDSKTFVDADPLRDPADILKDYKDQNEDSDFDLEQFVSENFSLPQPSVIPDEVDQSADLSVHLVNHWDYLSRKPDDSSKISSLLPLPYSYIVPGGRFREIYYWDSYFTMIGLAASDRWDMIESMTDNFAHLIDEVGFIPNGNRTYYLTRSQPPFFSSIVSLQIEKYGEVKGVKYLPQLIKEYDFWMNGRESLSETRRAVNHTVLLEDNVVLNRYYDQSDEPRPESYREDIELASKATNKSKVYRDLRSAAESGWDFSTRWFDEDDKFETISTTDLIPVDLNCLLHHLELTIAKLSEVSGDIREARKFRKLAESRRQAILKYCWDIENKYFTDFNFVKDQYSERVTLAGMFPLYYNICDLSQALDQSNVVIDKLLKPQGLVTTTINSGQQWDAPNGWAPLQWISVRGLENYELFDIADEIKKRWMDVNERVYENTGKMMEKYNVLDKSLEAGGGEYPTQDGFGWTNGVYLGLDRDFREY